MGIFIYLNIADSVTENEWNKAYQKATRLMEKLPFAEEIQKDFHGVRLVCLRKTVEKERRGKLGWCTSGDTKTLKLAEEFCLRKKLFEQDDKGAGFYVDPYMSILPPCNEWDHKDERCRHVIKLWGSKTQGEPYHIFLLAIACLLEQELPGKVAVFGDITRGQCRTAAELASDFLEEPIRMPDRCDMQRLYDRVIKMPLQEEERVDVFTALYLGNQDAQFGSFARKHFSSGEFKEFWRKTLGHSRIGGNIFFEWLKKYILWEFPISELKEYVQIIDPDGSNLAEKFVKAVLDTEVFIMDKDCEDVLEIDQEDGGLYSIYTILAQFAFAGARNHRVNKYIPLAELKKELTQCVGEYCNVAQIVDEYIKKRDMNTDDNPTDVLNKYMRAGVERDAALNKKFDIVEADDLMYYERGDTIEESLNQSLLRSFAFLKTLLKEEGYKKLLEGDAEGAIRFLIKQNRYLVLREDTWEKIFSELDSNIQVLDRYYPLVRAKLEEESQVQMIQALMLNDDLYQYCCFQTAANKGVGTE